MIEEPVGNVDHPLLAGQSFGRFDVDASPGSRAVRANPQPPNDRRAAVSDGGLAPVYVDLCSHHPRRHCVGDDHFTGHCTFAFQPQLIGDFLAAHNRSVCLGLVRNVNIDIALTDADETLVQLNLWRFRLFTHRFQDSFGLLQGIAIRGGKSGDVFDGGSIRRRAAAHPNHKFDAQFCVRGQMTRPTDLAAGGDAAVEGGRQRCGVARQ